MQGLGFVGCLWDCPGGQTQMQMGVSNFIMVQCDHISTDTLPCTWLMRTGVSISGMGMNNVALFDNIIQAMYWDGSTPAPGFAVLGFKSENNHYMAYKSFDATAQTPVGMVSFDRQYRPTGGLSKPAKGRTQDGRPLYQWNLDGTRIDTLKPRLVGAQQP